jgi:hypothetical protein
VQQGPGWGGGADDWNVAVTIQVSTSRCTAWWQCGACKQTNTQAQTP